MERLNKAINRRNRRLVQHSPYKQSLDRFIPRRKESNVDRCHQQLVQGGTKSRHVNHVISRDVTGDWRLQCASLVEKGEETVTIEDTKILVFSPTQEKKAGSSPSNQKKAAVKRLLPNSPESVFDLPGLIDDPFRQPLDWSSENQLSVGLGMEVYTRDILAEQQCFEVQAPASVTCVVWDERGQHLAIGTVQGHIVIRNTSSGKLQWNYIKLQDRIVSLVWNSNSTILYGLFSGGLFTLEISSYGNPKIKKFPLPHEPVSCQLQPSQAKLAIGTKTGQIYVWSVEERKVQKCWECHQATVKALAWVTWKPHVLVSACNDQEGSVKVWNANSGEMLHHVQTSNPVQSLVINDRHRELITGHSSGEVKFWQVPSLQPVASKLAHDGRVLHLTLSPDRTKLVSLGSDECLMLWDCFQNASNYPTSTAKKRLLGTPCNSPIPIFGSLASMSMLR